MVYESAGMQASLLGVSKEGFVIDNDMLGAVNRSIRGIEINEESMSVQAMHDVCVNGPESLFGSRSDNEPDAERLRLSQSG